MAASQQARNAPRPGPAQRSPDHRFAAPDHRNPRRAVCRGVGRIAQDVGAGIDVLGHHLTELGRCAQQQAKRHRHGIAEHRGVVVRRVDGRQVAMKLRAEVLVLLPPLALFSICTVLSFCARRRLHNIFTAPLMISGLVSINS